METLADRDNNASDCLCLARTVSHPLGCALFTKEGEDENDSREGAIVYITGKVVLGGTGKLLVKGEH